MTPRFFDTLGTPLVAGRDFTWDDAPWAERVAIVNRAAAARFFGSDNPIGRRLTVGLDASRRNLTIVGVVSDAKYQRLQEEQREVVYLPYSQAAEALNGEVYAAIRVPDVTDAAIREVRDALATTGRTVPPVQRLTDRFRESLVTELALALVALALASCACFLAGVGIYGLMAHSVARRTREIGVRIALGAHVSQIVGQVVRQSLLIAALGLLAGLAAAWGSVRWIAGLLHGVSINDLTTYAAVVAVTLGIAVVAGLIPARRAAAVDPHTALRAE